MIHDIEKFVKYNQKLITSKQMRTTGTQERFLLNSPLSCRRKTKSDFGRSCRVTNQWRSCCCIFVCQPESMPPAGSVDKNQLLVSSYTLCYPTLMERYAARLSVSSSGYSNVFWYFNCTVPSYGLADQLHIHF